MAGYKADTALKYRFFLFGRLYRLAVVVGAILASAGWFIVLLSGLSGIIKQIMLYAKTEMVKPNTKRILYIKCLKNLTLPQHIIFTNS